jgi:hypothetical protein
MKTIPVSLSCVLAAMLLMGLSQNGLGQVPHGPTAPMDHARGKAVPSNALSVTVGGKTVSLTVAELEAMPQKTVNVHNSHNKMDETYTGVALTDVLAKAGPAEGKPLLRSYVRAQGTDGYWVLYSGIEIEGVSHSGEVIVATTVGGKPLGDSGAFQLVSSEDKKPQRWVRNLAGVTLVAVE